MTPLPAAIVHCAPLGRDLAPILSRVPQAFVQHAPLTPGEHVGCILGHQAIVRHAMAQGWPAVFVIEDDCTFTDAFSLEQWQADAEWARTHGYDALVGGCVSTRNPRRVREGLVAIDRFKSTHCITYFASGYGFVLRMSFPMDVMFGKLGGRAVLTVPFVAVQGPSYSGIQQRDVDYRAMYARHEQHLMGIAA